MPATSFSGDCFARRSAIGRAGSPSKSRMTKSSSVRKHLAEVVVAVDADARARLAPVCAPRRSGRAARCGWRAPLRPARATPRSTSEAAVRAVEARLPRASACRRTARAGRRDQRLRHERRPRRPRQRQVQLRGAAPEDRALVRYQFSSAAKNGGGPSALGWVGRDGGAVSSRPSLASLRPARARDPLVVAPQLVDGEVPTRSLMLTARLHERQRAGLEPGRTYSSAPASAGVRVNPCSASARPISSSGFGPGSIRRNSFTTYRSPTNDDAVALIAAASRPSPVAWQIEHRRRSATPRTQPRAVRTSFAPFISSSNRHCTSHRPGARRRSRLCGRR